MTTPIDLRNAREIAPREGVGDVQTAAAGGLGFGTGFLIGTFVGGLALFIVTKM